MTLQEFTEQHKKAYGLTGLDFCQNEEERKFTIMSSIAVALRRKGFMAAVSFFDGFCHIVAQDADNEVVADVFSPQVTESDLLDWLLAILGESNE